MNNRAIAHLWTNEKEESAMVVISSLKVKVFILMAITLRPEES